MLNSTHLWFYCALGTAIMWGFSYALSEKVMKDAVHPLFIMVVTGVFYLFLSLAAAYFTDNLKAGLNLIANDKNILFNLVVMSVAYVVGMFLIFYAINLKNASMANLIEISYPVFTIIFAYFISKEVQINLSTFVGGTFIFAGICIIYLKA
jgi:drug/metabolite transporter (DMT)-like permease